MALVNILLVGGTQEENAEKLCITGQSFRFPRSKHF
jgi:hypothetical protein